MWPFGETVIVHRRTGVTQDGDGNDVPTTTPQTYEGTPIGPGSTLELNANQTLVDDNIHAYFKPAVPLTAVDQIEVMSGLYAGLWECDGEPKQYHSPFTNGTITDAVIKRVTG